VAELLGLTGPRGEQARAEVEEVVAGVAAAVDRLTGRLDWTGGIRLLREAQVAGRTTLHCTTLHCTAQARVAAILAPPSLEHFHCTIAVWRALWLLVGNKRLTKVF
jgi:hypothetical protein